MNFIQHAKDSYRFHQCMSFTRKMMELRNTKESYKAFENFQTELNKKPIQKTPFELREILHDISPGLGHTDCAFDIVNITLKRTEERKEILNDTRTADFKFPRK